MNLIYRGLYQAFLAVPLKEIPFCVGNPIFLSVTTATCLARWNKMTRLHQLDHSAYKVPTVLFMPFTNHNPNVTRMHKSSLTVLFTSNANFSAKTNYTKKVSHRLFLAKETPSNALQLIACYLLLFIACSLNFIA